MGTLAYILRIFREAATPIFHLGCLLAEKAFARCRPTGAQADRVPACPSPAFAFRDLGGGSTGHERMDLEARTVADAFEAAGYATDAFGSDQ